jgi:hypothetical protein
MILSFITTSNGLKIGLRATPRKKFTVNLQAKWPDHYHTMYAAGGHVNGGEPWSMIAQFGAIAPLLPERDGRN